VSIVNAEDSAWDLLGGIKETSMSRTFRFDTGYNEPQGRGDGYGMAHIPTPKPRKESKRPLPLITRLLILVSFGLIVYGIKWHFFG
jgi:hypothetical protein